MSRLKISYGFIALICIAYYLLRFQVIMAFLLAAAVHELAHYIALKHSGARIAMLHLNVTGAVMEIEGTLSHKGEIIVALSGPFASFVLSFTGALYGGGYFISLLTGISLALGIFNILPILPLDGGRALQSVLEMFASIETADAVMFAVSIAFAFILATIGISLYISGVGGIALLFMAVWLIVGTLKGQVRPALE